MRNRGDAKAAERRKIATEARIETGTTPAAIGAAGVKTLGGGLKLARGDIAWVVRRQGFRNPGPAD